MKVTLHFESMDEFMSFISGEKPVVPVTGKHKVKDAGLTVRAENCLLSAGIEYMEDAKRLGSTGLLKLPSVGKLTMVEILHWEPRA